MGTRVANQQLWIAPDRGLRRPEARSVPTGTLQCRIYRSTAKSALGRLPRLDRAHESANGVRWPPQVSRRARLTTAFSTSERILGLESRGPLPVTAASSLRHVPILYSLPSCLVARANSQAHADPHRVARNQPTRSEVKKPHSQESGDISAYPQACALAGLMQSRQARSDVLDAAGLRTQEH